MPVEEDYLASLGQMTTMVGEGAHALVEMFGDERGEAERYAAHIKTIEHEDINALANALDGVVDLIDALASAVVMYGVQEYTAVRWMFAGVIQQMSLELDLLVPTLDRPKELSPRLLKLHELEREGDEI